MILPKQLFLFTIAFFSFHAMIGQSQSQRSSLVVNDEKLTQLKQKIEKSQSDQKERVHEFASKNGLPTGKFFRDNKVIEIQKITQENTPLFYATYNANAARSIGTTTLNSGGSLSLNLNGEMMTLGIWEGDAVRIAHQELSNRVIVIDGTNFNGSNSGTEHATHVAGTMIASGVSSNAKGMAPEASLRAYDWNFDESEMATFGAAGYLISNHSYGFCTDPDPSSRGGCDWPDWRFGYYDDTAEGWDEIAFAAPYYLIAKAAGNDGNDNRNTSRNGFDLLEGAGTAKNVLIVGAANDVLNYNGPSSVTLASFSSVGPTDDGRIKPDIVGNGVNVRSSFSGSNFDYESISGTSMATPNVSGSLILLQQHYNNINDSFMKSATLRGLVIHSSKEAGTNPGPDYKFGWGLVDVEAAAEIISNDQESTQIEEHTLNNGESFQKIIKSDGLTPLTVTICWTDPKGNPLPENSSSNNSTALMLVNDLDCRIGKGTDEFLPWVLNPDNFNAAATNGDNFRDNVEKIEIENPDFGEYTITINHKDNLTTGSQNFSLIVSGVIPSSCSPIVPGNFSANDVTDNSAIVSWDPLFGINNYQGRYREKGATEWIDFSTTTNNITLSDLLSGTIYEVEMQSRCSSVDISGFSDIFTFQTECRPDIPDNLSFDNITTTSIHLDWDTVRAIQSYEVRYRISGSRTWTTQNTSISEIDLSGLSSGTTYDFQVSSQCSADFTSDFSTSLQFTPYCIASGENSSNEWIELVQIGTIDNASGNNNGYVDFSNLATELQTGSEVEIGLLSGEVSNFPKYWAVWIDFNQNGRFTDDGEKILSIPVDPGNLTSTTFSIPLDAPIGNTLMRISLKYNEEPGSCEMYSYGETEDYTVNIQNQIDVENFTTIMGSSIASLPEAQLLSVYPNPASDQISINLDAGLVGSNVNIMDMSGNIILSLPFESRMIVDINTLNQGIYLVRIETSSGFQVKRFIKN